MLQLNFRFIQVVLLVLNFSLLLVLKINLSVSFSIVEFTLLIIELSWFSLIIMVVLIILLLQFFQLNGLVLLHSLSLMLPSFSGLIDFVSSSLVDFYSLDLFGLKLQQSVVWLRWRLDLGFDVFSPDIMLFVLEFLVISDDLLDDKLVWGWHMMVFEEILVALVDASPASNFFIESQVAENDGGSSADTRWTVDVDLVPFAVDKIIQILSGCKNFLWMIELIIVVNWIVNGRFDTSLLIDLTQFSPWVSSLIHIILCLEIEHGGDPNIFHFFNVLIVNWVWTNENILIVNLIDIEIF